MKKIKMFFGTNTKAIEEEINAWLEEKQSLKICKFLQTCGNGGIYTSIIYEV